MVLDARYYLMEHLSTSMEAQNLPIQHIIDDFNKGTINKARYIECMYELFHSKLHQYGEIIENTNIA
jgi:hypothetical protein